MRGSEDALVDAPREDPAAVATPVVVALEVVSDAICPWCYVGKRRLEAALAMLPAGVTVDVTWLPFELNPDMPKGGVERDDYRRRKFGSLERSRALDKQVAAVAAGEGIAMRHDLMQRTPNTFDAHRLIWLAKQEGVQDRLVEALFRAYFVEGCDIGDHAVLADLAAGAGIAGTRASQLLASDEGVDEVAALAQAAVRRGVSGVPTFVLQNSRAFSGAQPAAFIAEQLLAVARER